VTGSDESTVDDVPTRSDTVGSSGTSRSSREFERPDADGFSQRMSLKGMGLTDEARIGRPVIGICNTWSEFVHCNVHFRALAEHVRRGIYQAGGLAFEFPVTSLGEPFMKPTTMLYRNLMAMDVEENIRAYPMDAVVLLVGCDKTIPASIMGALSADIPAIVLPGGPQLNAIVEGRSVGACTDCWRTIEAVRAGVADERRIAAVEDGIVRSIGHCPTMGTASTMACLAEALGLTLPGAAAIPAPDSRRNRLAEATGRMAVDLAKRGVTPRTIVTASAVDNAITVLQGIAGSTNAVIHLVAIARRAGVDLPLSRFDEIGRSTPMLVNVKPAGDFLMEDFFFAGGVPVVMNELRNLLDLDALTVTGESWAERLSDVAPPDGTVIRSRANPIREDGSIVVLSGNLCPDGAVLKVAAADAVLLRHEGRARVFESLEDVRLRIDDESMGFEADDVLILRGLGPVGAPGMPEAGHVPIPQTLLQRGVTDMVRISDARMSGTAYGTCVLHVAPEAAVGGPLGLVQDGDIVRLDVPARRLDVLVDDAELRRRRDQWAAPVRRAVRGYEHLYVTHVEQANLGCDFDFLADTSTLPGDLVEPARPMPGP
jgi:dihydroxy-acid dehydratase